MPRSDAFSRAGVRALALLLALLLLSLGAWAQAAVQNRLQVASATAEERSGRVSGTRMGSGSWNGG